MTIVLDAMGSDKYPLPEIEAAVTLAEQNEDIILVGNQELVEPRLKELNPRKLPIRIHHAPDVHFLRKGRSELFSRETHHQIHQ